MAALDPKNNRRQLICDFLRANPNSSSRDVGQAFGMTARNANHELDQLERQGRAISSRTVGKRQTRWSFGDETGRATELGDLPCCTVKKEWSPVQIKPQGIFAALGI